MKETKASRDKFKKLYNETLTLQDGKKSEIISMLSDLILRLIDEVNLTSKNKDIFKLILKMLNFEEKEIEMRLDKKKKKSFFG